MNPRESRSIWDVTLHNQDGLGNAKRVRDMLLAMETGVLIQGSGRWGRNAKKIIQKQNTGKLTWRVRKVVKSQGRYPQLCIQVSPWIQESESGRWDQSKQGRSCVGMSGLGGDRESHNRALPPWHHYSRTAGAAALGPMLYSSTGQESHKWESHRKFKVFCNHILRKKK